MKKYFKMFLWGGFIVSLIVFSMLYLTPFMGTVVIGALCFFLVYYRTHANAKLTRQLLRYEEAAVQLTSGKKADYIAPIALSQDEVFGSAYNDLIKYVGDRGDEVRKSRQMIKSVTMAIDAPLVIVNTYGRIDYANYSFLKMVKRESLKNTHYGKLKNKELRQLLEDALIRERDVKKDIYIRGKFYEAISTPLYEESRQFTGIVVLFQDVTELKNYQNLQREFFTNASHELKTPIAAIKGSMAILKSGKVTETVAAEFLDIIETENARLEQLVKDLFLVSRYDMNQIDLNKEEIDLNLMIVTVIDQVYNMAKLKSQPIRFFEKSQVTLFADGLKIEQCLLNLLTNAVHYSPDATEIELTLSQSDTDIQIELKDYGTGIPEADLPHIFERFYRVEKGRARHTGGTGLGLSIVKSTIEAHGGVITAQSAEEIGTTFTIILPRTDA